ncbi:Ferric siderophore transport system, periplasmic binding protein TonB [Myxococcus hansupus]|uniref:Ferric siderophore transport system, periplasmic binding protein TonB n=1 Tax=Pseudomyxococcus hansupus TaxID=1297742 RepID=A0A0H4WNS1_9BACT|nr:adventurous gliding motility protein GltJ [Myxococcus hansupus]AKQ65111.1 Ferric siderophore transport system, periplasmic binding protein TonB [Myxococcus hansupus]
MRFVCDSCRAQYMISDDKIGPKGVKVRCKKCGHTITVRPAGAPAAKDSASEAATSESSTSSEASKGNDAAATMPATLGTPPEGGLFTDVEEDEIGAVFDQVLSSGTHKIPTEAANEAAAREASAENVRKLAEAEAEPDKDDAKSNAAAHEWYVAIDEKQVGPFSVEKVKDLWDRGEVGPDSLCWRSGFSDWIPLSETAELASVLAPRPSKPVIVAPEPVSGSTPTVSSGPVQSAFSAGKGARGESGPAPASEEPVGWKPSAASVLASLVKEENDALSKPPPTPAPALGREPVSQSRLLDVPMPPPEPVSSPSLRGAEVPMAQPMAAPMPYGQPQAPQYAQPAPMPYGHQPQAPQYAQPMPAPYPPPGYPPAYPPAGVGQGGGKGKTGLFVGIAAGLLVVGGGAMAFFMKGGAGTDAAPVPPPVVAAAPPPVAAPTPPPPAPPPVVATAPAAAPEVPVNAAPPPGTEVAAAPANTATAPAPTPPPETTPTAVAAAPTPTPAAPEPSKPPETLVAKVERPSSSRRTTSSSRREDPEPRTTPAPARAERPSSNDSDDDFDELFGTKKPSSSESKTTAARPTAYVPPEPGGGMPDRLQQSDIMAVVLANKPAIIKCVNEQKKKDPSLSGKLVMRWTIETSGKTAAVSCRTDEFRSTYMASCITGLIKSWSFPRHKRKGEPIDFPFTF